MSVRVLLVDDDAAFREALEKVLTDAGFSVITASTGSQALAELDRSHGSIDVAIVDLNLPEVSGFEVIGAISRRQTVMGVLATTAVYRQNFIDIAQYLGAHIAIRKPDNYADLQGWIPAIRSILRAEGEIGKAHGALK